MVVLKSPDEVVYLSLSLQLLRRKPPFPNSPKQLLRDSETMKSRTASEGLSFLTKTLPRLGKALDQGLIAQRFTPVTGFRRQKGRSTPAFMQEYFNRVFDEDGQLLESACPRCVMHLRQVLFFAYKLETPYSEDEEAGVIQAFVDTEEELASLDISEDDPIVGLASRIVAGIFKGFDPRKIIPRHGPGAVSSGERGEQKWKFSTLYNSIHQVYPYYDFYITGGWKELGDRYEWYKGLSRKEAGTAKVILVPKDSRGPRLISCEPLEVQWIQQGLGRKLVEHLEGSKSLAMGKINFSNQEVNRQLALLGSLGDQVSTIDLEAASDRVSLDLVRGVFKGTPALLRSLEAVRSTATALPNGRVLELRKFAPMGSAVCFPVEAVIFWATMVAAVVLDTGEHVSRVARSIYVYGDDIVVPRAWAERCIAALEHVGLRVNRKKCCVQGPFRESCGMDAFRGVCVTPTRLRKPWSGRSSDGTAFAAYSSLMNDLREKGYVDAAGECERIIQLCFGPLPYGTRDSGYPCIHLQSEREAFLLNRWSGQRLRWSSRFQRWEVRVKCVVSPQSESSLDDWPRLLRNNVAQAGLEPSKVVESRSTQIKRGWRPV
jgi:hypothetical protein